MSFNKGLVSIQLRSGNTVKLEQIRKAVMDQGFKPKDAAVEVIGQIRSPKGKLEFVVTNAKDVY